MDFHPRDVPIHKTYDLKDEGDAAEAAGDMVRLGFRDKRAGFKVLMPKEARTAKRIGYIVTTGVTHGLREAGAPRDIRYWTFHHDKDHYAIVLVSNSVLEQLGL